MISQTTQSLCDELKERDRMGYDKYSTTVDRGDLKASDWCQHAIEEQMDNLKYMKRLKDKLLEAGL